MKTWLGLVFILGIVLSLSGCWWFHHRHRGYTKKRGPTITMTVRKITMETIIDFMTAAGTTINGAKKTGSVLPSFEEPAISHLIGKK